MHNDKVIILAVNTKQQHLKNISFHVAPGGSLSQVNVLTENRKIQVNDSKSWSDNFEGYGVRIYETDIYFSFLRR